MTYKLVARLPVPLSGTLKEDFPDLASAIQSAKILLGQNKDYLIEVSDSEGRPVNIAELLHADRT